MDEAGGVYMQHTDTTAYSPTTDFACSGVVLFFLDEGAQKNM
jgi:hypothetical protein